jgi:hypothetical protein
MPYGPTSSPLPLNAPQMQFAQPQPYTGGAANAQRDSITQALMDIQNPRPRTQVPPGMGAAPTTQSPTAAPGAAQGQAPGMPAAIPPGAGMQPGGLMPGAMNQTMQPGAVMPSGPNFAPPPQVGIPPAQSPMTPPPMTPPIGGQQL